MTPKQREETWMLVLEFVLLAGGGLAVVYFIAVLVLSLERV